MSCVVFTLKVTDSPSVAKRLMWPTSSATWQLTKVFRVLTLATFYLLDP